MRDLFSDYSQRLQLEKLVIGLEEPIFIKGIGEFVAKIDSGNGGFNVIHGEDVYQNGGVLVFKTYDKDNELKQVSKKLIQYINVNIGSGKVEQRPVIELDIKFGDKEYEKIPFSVANRTSNQHKVLICKDFIQNQLNALIDVSGKMLSDKGVEVEYIKEGVGNALKKDWEKTKQDAVYGSGVSKAAAKVATTAGGALKLADKALGIIPGYQGVKDKIKSQGGILKSIAAGFQGAGKFTDASMIGAVGKDAEEAKEYDELIKQDKKLIMRKLGASQNDLLIYKLIDYQGKFFKGGDKPTKVEQPRFNKFQECNKAISKLPTEQVQQQVTPATPQAQQAQPVKQVAQTSTSLPVKANTPKTASSAPQPQQQQVESFETKLVNMILNEAAAPVNPNANANVPTAPASSNQVANAVDNSQPPAQENNQPVSKQEELQREYDRISEIYNNNRQKFYVYFIQVSDDIKQQETKYGAEIMALLKKPFPRVVDRFFGLIGEKRLNFNVNSGNQEINTQFIKGLNYLPQSKLSQKIATTFAICFGNLSNRKIWLSDNTISLTSYKLEALDDFISALQSGEDKKIVTTYKKLAFRWKEDPFLKYQKLNLRDDNFDKLNKALSNLDNENSDVNLHLKLVKDDLSDLDNNALQNTAKQSQKIVYAIKTGVVDKQDDLSQGVWDKLVKFQYIPKGISDTENTTEEPDTEDTDEQGEIDNADEQTPEPENQEWEQNPVLKSILQSVSYNDLTDEDKLELAKLVQQRVKDLSGSNSKSGNEAIDNILQSANISYGELSDEDKISIAKLFQQRIKDLQSVAQVKESWQKNPILGNILNQVPYEQIDDNDKSQLIKLIQDRINKLQKAA